MARRLLILPLLAVALGAALAGCGNRSADLFSVDRAGAGPGARLRLVVNDGGTLTCNGGPSRRMPDAMLLAARQLQRDLEAPNVAGLDLAPGPRSVLRYDVRTPSGRVRFADNSRRTPPALDRLALFVHQAAQRVCRLAR